MSKEDELLKRISKLEMQLEQLQKAYDKISEYFDEETYMDFVNVKEQVESDHETQNYIFNTLRMKGVIY